MSKRFINQLIYGIFFLTILAALFALGYILFIKPAPTCTDNIQNQDEEQIDCGGSTCIPCAIKQLKPLTVLPVQLFDAGDNRTTVFVQIQNTNSGYGGSIVPYALNLYDQAGVLLVNNVGETFVYANTIRPLVIPVLAAPFQKIFRSEFIIGEMVWSNSAIFVQPKLELRAVQTILEDTLIVVSGMMQNTNAFALRNVSISAVGVDARGLFVNASKTELEHIPPFGESLFKIFMPVTPQEKELLEPTRTKVFADGVR